MLTNDKKLLLEQFHADMTILKYCQIVQWCEYDKLTLRKCG